MANQLTQQDLDILNAYKVNGDRKRYWSYLAENCTHCPPSALDLLLGSNV